MTREDFLNNWNNIDVIEDNNGKAFVINKTEAYANKEEFLKDCKDNNFIDCDISVNDVTVGGISCYVSMQQMYYSISKKHGKIDREAYYISI